ncbi:hypothetical protein C8T65DRAFT_739000 [Cerioporus squamosus]|nr:hypothetical protein C8T65DRAFT_739000 [Cerioporus squamosus]
MAIHAMTICASSLQEDSDSDSDLEDFGQLCSVANEDSTRSGFTQYHSAVSHVSNLDDMAAIAELSIIDEDSGIAFTSSPQRCKERSVNDPALFQISCSRSFEDGASRFTIQPPRTPYLLAAPTPSIVLTMPTPQISQSPVFQPRSPITLAKYVQATASSQSPCLTPAVSTSSLSPVPSIPSCNRCCLAQLEDGVICRACERQWLACKMWYQAHDGGRRLQLTEPFIRPAESNASVRAVMGVLGVPGSTATVGLGFEPSVTLRKKLPFKVVERAIQPPCSRCNYDSCARPGNCRDRATPWRRLRKHSLDAVKKTRDTLRALFGLHLHSSLSFKSVSAVPPPRSWSCLPRGDLAFTSPATPDSSAASWTARIAPYRLAHCSSEPSPSYGSSLFHRQLACVTSGSRFVEHLVV